MQKNVIFHYGRVVFLVAPTPIVAQLRCNTRFSVFANVLSLKRRIRRTAPHRVSKYAAVSVECTGCDGQR